MSEELAAGEGKFIVPLLPSETECKTDGHMFGSGLAPWFSALTTGASGPGFDPISILSLSGE